MLRRPPALLLTLGLAAGATPAAHGQDPFAPGEVWSYGATAAERWIPDSVALSGREASRR